MANIDDPKTLEKGFDPAVEDQALGLAIIAVVAVIGGSVYSALPDSMTKTYVTSPNHPYDYVGDANTDERLNNRFEEFTARCEGNGPGDTELARIVKERRRIFAQAGVTDDITWKCQRDTGFDRKGRVSETVPRTQDRGQGAQTRR